jgi:hypothetical protein
LAELFKDDGFHVFSRGLFELLLSQGWLSTAVHV